MFKALSNVLTLLSTCQKSLPPDAFDAMRTAQCAFIQKSWATIRVDIEDVTAVFQTLQADVVLTQSQRDALVELITTKASTETSATSSSSSSAPADAGIASRDRHRNQTNLHLHNYLTDSDWVSLTSRDLNVDERMNAIISRCLVIGLAYPSEPTHKMIIALMVATAPCDTQPAEAFELLQDAKKQFRRQRPSVSYDFAPPIEYPHDAVAFAESTNTYVAIGLPVLSRVPFVTIEKLMAKIPSRSTHSSIATAHHSTKLSTLNSATSKTPTEQSMLLAVLQHLMGNKTAPSAPAQLSLPAPPVFSAVTPHKAPLAIEDAPIPEEPSSSKKRPPVGLEEMVAELQQTYTNKKNKNAATDDADDGQAGAKACVENQKHASTAKAKSKASAKAKSKATAAAASHVSKPTPKKKAKAAIEHEVPPAMPQMVKQPGIVYRGHRIYVAASSGDYRVQKISDETRYDKRFKPAGKPTWKRVIDYIDTNQ